MNHPEKFPRGYLPTLDGWRAVAILLVILYHGTPALIRLFGNNINWALPFLNSGGIGVDIFFAISGVLITSRLLEEIETKGSLNLKNFYIRRLFRIIPPLLFFLVVIALLGCLSFFKIAPVDLIRALCFGANYGPAIDSWYLVHTWSLSVEEHFYLFWPICLFLLGNRNAIYFGAALALTITVWRIADIHFEIVPAYIGYNWWRTDTRMDALLFGAVIACLIHDKRYQPRLERFLNPATTYFLLFFLLISLTAFAHNPHLQHPVRFFQMILMPLILSGTILNTSQMLSRFLEWSWFRWLGRLSYSLYLWQQLFFVNNEARSPSLARLQDWPFNFLAALICAMGSYYLLERPFIKLGHKLAHPVTEGRGDLART